MYIRPFSLPLSVWWRLLSFLIVLVAPSANAQTVQTEDVEMSGISGSADAPRRHFRLRNAARLGPQKAQNIYEIVQPSLRIGYARSQLSSATSYQSWRRFNTSPYISVTHGSHYLNNYTNKLGEIYGKYEDAGEFPVGAIIAKDSFAVTETGGILLGPLFLMEKMAEGFSYVTGNWKYSLIGPDGTVFGETNGEGSGRVEYCIACHLSVEHQDHLYFIPQDVRILSER